MEILLFIINRELSFFFFIKYIYNGYNYREPDGFAPGSSYDYLERNAQSITGIS